MSSKKRKEKSATSAVRKQEKPATQVTGWRSMTSMMILLVIILPLLFSTQERDPVLTIRYIFFSGFILLFVLFFYVLRRSAVKFYYPPLVKIIFGCGIAYVAWSLVSLSTAVNSSAAFYETSRYLLNIGFLFIVMMMARSEEARMLNLCKAILILSFLQSFVGILQYYEVAFTEIPGNFSPYGLMANRNLFGSAQVLLLPFILFVLYKGEKKWKYAAAFAIASIIASAILSQTRSAWIAVVIIMIVPLILILITSPANRRKWIIGTLSAIVAVAGIVSLLLFTDKNGMLSQSIKERTESITTIDKTNSSTAETTKADRLKIWEKTLTLIKDHPLTGVGPGNWKIMIPSYGTKGLAWAGGYYVPDRPHNVYLLITAETGIPGFILYFAVWVMVALAAIKVIRKSANEDRRVINILMLAGLLAFASDSMFSFPNERIEHSLYLLLMSGIILGSYCNLFNADKIKSQNIGMPLIVSLIVVAAFNFFLGFKKHSFEVRLNRADAFNKLGQYRDVIDEAEKGKTSWVTVDLLGKSLEMYSSLAWDELKDYTKALHEADIAKKYNPNSAMVYNNLGTIYTDMKDYEKAIENYNKALQFAPDFELVYKNLSVNYFQLGNYKACIDALSHVAINGDEYLTSLLNEAKKRLGTEK